MQIPQIPSILPLLPIRNAVLFPGASMPLLVGRPKSVAALKSAQNIGNFIVVVTQRQMSESDPSPDDLHRIGTLCRIENIVGTENGGYQVVVSGIIRYRIAEIINLDTHLAVRGENVADVHEGDSVRTTALFNNLKELSKEILELLPGAGEALAKLVDKLDDPTSLTNLCAAYLNIPTPQKQELLEEFIIERRMDVLLRLMGKEREVLQLQQDIRSKMAERLTKAQRDALLREQLRTIREELGEEGGEVNSEISKRIEASGMTEEARKISEDELRRLENIPSASAEYHVIRTYLDWLCNMPWKKSTQDVIDIERARQILDEDHYGLEHVKKRILQYLSVAKLKNDLHGPILCLVGPPGVGKTSLGQSIARSLGRKFIRTSLGGLRDEAEIRGHRRTYIGALPGRIIQNLKRIGVNNPLFMLDEIDKLGSHFQGDPASAMLEVLDPEQNKAFVDHYLDVAFDLSNVFFIATANVIDTIPAPLRDRMEIIEVTGYTMEEKKFIAQRYLVPKQLTEHGLTPKQTKITDDAIIKIMASYTREAGVRELQRQIASLCRAAAENIVKGKSTPIVINAIRAAEFLGPEKFIPEVLERTRRPGVVTGLAWTPQGGDILFIEVSAMEGSGELILTGQLGDVMKESAKIAMSCVRAEISKLAPKFKFKNEDVHIHVPSGAIPKDGPSAGIAIFSAIASLLTNKTVNPKLAMTGELTLRGVVLPVGGIKEKVIAAHRAGIQTVLLPKRNEKDLPDIPKEIRSKLKIKFVETAVEVLRFAFREK